MTMGGRPIDYLEWSTTWRYIKEFDPQAAFEIHQSMEGLPYFKTELGILVHVSLTIKGMTESDWFPVDGDSVRDITDAHQRALCKAAARHGFALKLWEKNAREELKGEKKEVSTLKRSSVDGRATAAQVGLLYRKFSEKNYRNQAIVNAIHKMGYSFRTLDETPFSEVNNMLEKISKLPVLIEAAYHPELKSKKKEIRDPSEPPDNEPELMDIPF